MRDSAEILHSYSLTGQKNLFPSVSVPSEKYSPSRDHLAVLWLGRIYFTIDLHFGE